MVTDMPIAPNRISGPRRLLVSWAPLILAFVGVAVVGFFVLRPSSGPTGLVGRTAPDFTLRDTAGHTVRLSALRGHPVLVNFWGVSCPPCRREVPLLQAAYQRYRTQGLVVLGLDAQQDDLSSVGAFAAERNVTYPMLLDPSGKTAIGYGVSALPHSFIVDRRGIVRESDPQPFLDPGPLQQAITYIL